MLVIIMSMLCHYMLCTMLRASKREESNKEVFKSYQQKMKSREEKTGCKIWTCRCRSLDPRISSVEDDLDVPTNMWSGGKDGLTAECQGSKSCGPICLKNEEAWSHVKKSFKKIEDQQ